jgi:putative ABC transport system permease protein
MSAVVSEWAHAVRQHARAAHVELPADVIEEIAAHVEDIYLAALQEGETETKARELALSVLRRATLPELQHRRRGAVEPPLTMSAGLWQGTWFDVRYGARMLQRSPIFAVALTGILALSIGTTTATFSVVDAVLLRPLPYPSSHELTVLSRVDRQGRPGHLSSADWLDYATRVRAFAGLAAYANWTHNLSGDGEPLRLRSVITSGSFFAVLATPAAIGRVYSDADDQPGAPSVVVLSDGFWSRRFGRDPSVVGRTLILNSRAAQVVGVMPRAFQYPSDSVDLWMPIGMNAELRADRASEWLQAVARLQPDVSIEAAHAETTALSAALAASYPKTNSDEGAHLVPLLEHVVEDVRPALVIVSGAVIFVFLITCLNAASLLLARASARRDEMAVRLAMGANTWRLLRQVLVESALLTAVATAAGIGVGWVLLQGFVALAAERVPRLADTTLDGGSLAAAAVASGVIVASCGVAIAVALRHRLPGTLARGGVRVSRAPGLRPLLLTTQIALSFVLVTAALLLVASYMRLQQVPAGFDTADVLSVRLTLARQKYPDNAAHVRFADAVVSELSEAPGVSSVGVVNDLPLAGNQMSFAIETEDVAPPSGTPPRVIVRLASPGYFETLRIPLMSGRSLSTDDREGRDPVVVVSRRAAEQFWSGDAVGRRVRIGGLADWRRVIGIVGDIRHGGFQEPEGPVVYIPYAQKPFDFVNWLGILVRGPEIAEALNLVKARIAGVDDTHPVYDVLLLDEYVERAQAPFRVNSWVVGGLAVLSLLLAVSGVFALTAYNAATRRQEYGIRLALGATSGTVLRLVLANAMRYVVAGIIVGAAVAFMAAQALTTLLFEMTPRDPRVFAAVASFLLVAAAAAALPPALRAARLDPATTIRAE